MANNFSKDTAQQRTYRAFEVVISGEDAAIDLLQAALLIARIEYPELDMSPYLAQLDELGRRVQDVLARSPSDTPLQPAAPPDPLKALQAINQVLFAEEGFHANRGDYYNPDNSFFNKVLEERTGIPITLSLLYMEVGKRIGLELAGVALPYQFIVSCRLPEGAIYIDPYEQGLSLSMEACKERIRRMSRGRIKPHDHWFEPVTHRHFLVRMLNNLKHIYLNQEDYARMLYTCDLLLLLLPHSAHEWRNRGIIHLQLKHYALAKRDLLKYLELMPRADDRDEILQHIKTIRQIISEMN